MVAALAVVNAVGSVTVGDGPWFWAAPFEIGGEFGGRGLPAVVHAGHAGDAAQGRARRDRRGKHHAGRGRDRRDPDQAAGQAARDDRADRMARAIYPVHAPLDGDVVFAAATGEKPIDPLVGLTELGMVAANAVARAIARGVYLATALPFPDALPSWKERFG